MKVYDLIILGAGPAGATASMYAARKKVDSLVVTKDIGGQAALSGDVVNYTGYQFIKGPELVSKFKQHMRSFNININLSQEVKEIKKEENLIKTITNKAAYSSRTLIVATGKSPRMLGVEGEKEFKNKGVTYCTTCDGPVFQDKKVAIIGGGNSALEAALQMVKISPKVYIINRSQRLRADPIMLEKINSCPGAELLLDCRVKKIKGDSFVNSLEVEQQGKTYNLSVEGVFVEIGSVPNTDFVSFLSRNELGEIEVDSSNRTSQEGIFAAGDCTNIAEKQIIIACGEGAKASLAVFKYLSSHKF